MSLWENLKATLAARKMSMAKLAGVSGGVAALFALSNAASFAGLALTSPGSAITFVSSSAVFVYGLSWLLLGESATWGKSLAVVLCLGGTAMTAMAEHDSSHAPNPVAGDIICAFAGLLLALGLVFFNMTLRGANISYLTGYVTLMGLMAFVLAPGFLIQQYGQKHPVELPPSGQVWLWTLIAQLLLKALNVFVFVALLVSSPLFVAIANMLCVPTTVLVDYIHGWIEPSAAVHSSPVRLAGIAVVILGFSVLETLRHRDAPPPEADHELDPAAPAVQ